MGEWISLSERRPAEGEWVLMYLAERYAKYAGVDLYRAGMYMGPNDWMSAANIAERRGVLPDEWVSHWMPLPPAPERDFDVR
jgi:hypothetical protein